MSGRSTTALAMLFVFCAGPAGAVDDEHLNFRTTEDLYTVCATAPERPEYAAAILACRAFINATLQYHDAVSDRKRMKRLICYPEGATIADARRAFLSWAAANKDNAERMGERPVMGVVRALAARYPCR